MMIQTRQITQLFMAVISRDGTETLVKAPEGMCKWENIVLGVPLTAWASNIELSWQCEGPDWSMGFRFAPADQHLMQLFDDDEAPAMTGYFFKRLGTYNNAWVADNAEEFMRMLVQIGIMGDHFVSPIPTVAIQFEET